MRGITYSDEFLRDRVFVHNLSSTTTEVSLKRYFEHTFRLPVKKVILFRNSLTQISQCCGIVEFGKFIDVFALCDNFMHKLDNKMISCEASVIGAIGGEKRQY